MRRWLYGIVLGVCLLCLGNSLIAQTPAFEVITAQNAAHIVPVASLGTGEVQAAYYDDNNNVDLISMGSRWHYDLSALTPSPQWQLLGHPWFETLALSPDHRWFVNLRGELWDQTRQVIAHDFGNRPSILRAVFSADSTLLALYLSKTCPQTLSDHCDEILVWDLAQQTLRMHLQNQAFRTLVFTPQGQFLAVVHEETTRFYDTLSGAFAFEIPAHLESWSNDGSTALSRRLDEDTQRLSFTVWDIATRSQRLTLTFLPNEQLQVAQLNEDGSRLLLSSSPSTWDIYDEGPGVNALTLWDTAGLRLAYFESPTLPLNDVKLSPDGRYIAGFTYGVMGNTASPLYLYDIMQPEPLWSLEAPSRRGIQSLNFRADSRTLLVVYHSGMIHEVDVVSAQVRVIEPGKPGYAEDILFGDGVIVTSPGGGSYVWDAETLAFQSYESGCELKAYDDVLEVRACRDDQGNTMSLSTGVTLEPNSDGHYAGLDMQFSPDKRLLAGMTPTELMLWDTTTGALLHNVPTDNPDYSQRVAFTSDGRFLIAGDHATVWTLPTLEPIAEVKMRPPWYSQFAISEVGDWLAFPTQEGYTYVWRLSDLLSGQDATAENAIATLPLSANVPLAQDQIGSPVYVSMEGSPDGRLIAMMGYDGVLVYDIATQTHLTTLVEGGNLVRFSPDGRFILVGDGTACCGFADESLHMGRARVWGVPAS